ncbi:hypothetical protein B0H10DRAFT_1968795 [Mycena sp. CBHHK59/15]|nr:hypothetical protein B0H10DRAFT_1968795 [Mycena sp. CBHHK59/15]
MAYEQSQRGQSYTFGTQEEWLASMPTTPHSPLDLGSDLCPGASDVVDLPGLEPADFADALCNTLGLNPKFRSDLHTFLTLLGSASRANAIPMIYTMATNLYTQQLILDSRADYAAIAEVMKGVKAILTQNLDMTKEQRDEVTAACKLKVWDSKRTDYDNDDLKSDVLGHLKKHMASNRCEPIFSSKGQARLKALNQFVGLQCSYGKSFLRSHIKETLKSCLTLATTSAMKKLAGSTENITPMHAMRMAIFSFSLSSKQATSVPASGRRGTDTNSWWPQMSVYLEAKNKELTTDLKSPGWTVHLDQLMANERRLFPNDIILLIPMTEVPATGYRSHRSGGDRPMRPLPTRSNDLRDDPTAFQLPPLHFPASTSGSNGLFLPSMSSNAGRQTGALRGSSIANQCLLCPVSALVRELKVLLIITAVDAGFNGPEMDIKSSMGFNGVDGRGASTAQFGRALFLFRYTCA